MWAHPEDAVTYFQVCYLPQSEIHPIDRMTLHAGGCQNLWVLIDRCCMLEHVNVCGC